MSEFKPSIGAITLFVENLAEAKAFYARTFELEVFFETEDSAVFQFGDTLINLLHTPEAHELIAPANVASPDAGSRVQLTIWVDDADAVCAGLQARGVTLLNGPMNREWGKRTAAFADPAGHVWEIAQDIPAS